MMKWFFGSLLALCIMLSAFRKKNSESGFVRQNLEFADRQIKLMLKDIDGDSTFPRTTDAAGKLISTNMYDWTPGFFPGNLWYAYEFNHDTALKTEAIRWTEKLEPLKDFTEHHDLGFMMYCSFGNAYRLT
ncbi:MAG: glycosyl hydrolase family 88, partial [Chitinophagaceae bacterium]